MTAETVQSTVRKGQRRKLRFESPEQAIAEARRLVDAENAGRLERSGNWTLGQNLAHLSAWLTFAFEGVPDVVKPPALLKFMMRNMFLGMILNKGMMSGVRISGLKEGTLGQDDIPAGEALARLEKAWTRMKASKPPHPNVLFGDLTHEQWIKLNLRHCELHMSFMHPR